LYKRFILEKGSAGCCASLFFALVALSTGEEPVDSVATKPLPLEAFDGEDSGNFEADRQKLYLLLLNQTLKVYSAPK